MDEDFALAMGGGGAAEIDELQGKLTRQMSYCTQLSKHAHDLEQRASLLGSSRIKGNLITPPGGFSMDLGSKFEGNFQVADAGSAARKSLPPFTEGQPEAPSTDSKKERSKSSK